MVLHDFRCRKCGTVFEVMVDWDRDQQPCPSCQAMADMVFLPPRSCWAQRFDPVLIYKDKNGNVRFPGRNQGRVPKGYEPVYLRTTSEVRKFERQMNETERRRYMDHKEREEATYASILAARRSVLRQKMQHMSAWGRDFAEVAMRANDAEGSVEMGFDPQFRVDAFSNDAGNRERDDRGRK